jgi:UDP-N-acetylmuramoyl-L-alanyl-D-glutamate--2,6-diaminopimelate ligase
MLPSLEVEGRMKLKKLLKELSGFEVRGSREVEVSGLSNHSQGVAPGHLFIARRGQNFDATRFIEEAVSSGAVAVLTDIYDPGFDKITQIISPDVASLEPVLAARYYGNPSQELFTVGVTGTNGKTTTAYIIQHLLPNCGLIGTIEYIVGFHRYDAVRTTPDVVANHKLLREMIAGGCTSAVMETTSHALEQGRTAGIAFDVGVYTNLSQDHLDYHKTMDNYARAKSRLFSQVTGSAVVNNDDPYHEQVLGNVQVPVLSYSIEGEADLVASSLDFSGGGTTFQLQYRDQSLTVSTSLTGRFNVSNCLAALGVALCQGIPLSSAVAALTTFPGVPGRMESISNSLGLNILVDFCHTPDALKNVLSALRESVEGRLVVVFGCGGDRDQTKRPLMGEVAEHLADLSIITSDNPRNEDPIEICNHILAGFRNRENVEVQVDRRAAIESAISNAKEGDTILVAGKGHEPTQTFAHETIAFDDRDVVRQITQSLSRCGS